MTAPYPAELVPEEDELSRALEYRYGDLRKEDRPWKLLRRAIDELVSQGRPD
jgi:hypothetical protein